MDLDVDGILDLVSGSYQRRAARPNDFGSVWFFRGLGQGRFQTPEELLGPDGEPIHPGQAADAIPNTRNFRRRSATDPCIADWDQDGDLDVLIGSMEGEVVLAENEGTAEEPRYARPRLLEHAGRPIRVWGGHGAPEVADWNGDGLPDLLCGCGDGAVFLFRNIGKPGSPRLAEGEVLIPRGARKQVIRRGDVPVPGQTARIDVVDYDYDGRPDILLGDVNRIFHVRDDLDDGERQQLDALLARRKKAVADEARILDAREREMYRLGHRPRGIFPRYTKKLEPIWNRISAVEKELEALTGPPTTHGFVWVFLRR